MIEGNVSTLWVVVIDSSISINSGAVMSGAFIVSIQDGVQTFILDGIGFSIETRNSVGVLHSAEKINELIIDAAITQAVANGFNNNWSEIYLKGGFQ